MSDKIKIICEFCGTTEIRTDVKEDVKYFPNRMVYLHNQLMPHKCKLCGNDNGLSIFGKDFIFAIWKPEINQYPEIIENNLIFKTKKK